MEENGWGNQLVRVHVFPKDKKRPLTRQATIELLNQLDIPYQIGRSGYPLIQQQNIYRINPDLYEVTITN